jgi:hypothetical protein
VTRDCLSLLSSDIRISFEQKKKTLAAFLDISGAYDNVLIDVLCGNLCGLQLPSIGDGSHFHRIINFYIVLFRRIYTLLTLAR